MRAIDTNVLVRFIAGGDEQQVASVDRLFESEDQPFFVGHIVLVELSWVLRTIYRMDRATLHKALSHILASPAFVVERDWLVHEALTQYRTGPADFADYLIGASAQYAGCRETLSFDRALARASDFKLVP